MGAEAPPVRQRLGLLGQGRAWNGRQPPSASSSAMSRSRSSARLMAVSRYCGSSAVVRAPWVAGTTIPAAAAANASTPSTAMANRTRAGEPAPAPGG